MLDIDASEGTTEACADAIDASMKKLTMSNNIRLTGQSMDSGGGGVLDGLAEALQLKKDLCVDYDDYKIGNCTLHALQLTLANPIKACIGEGKRLLCMLY